MHSSTKIKIFALAFETTLIGSSYYLNYLRHVKLGDMLFRRPLPQSAPSTITDKKTDEPISTEIADPSNNVPSRIIVRTTWVCSTVFAIPFFRDLLFPGQVLKWFPGDVQYLIFVKGELCALRSENERNVLDHDIFKKVDECLNTVTPNCK
ncbi:hypothetical protein TL16_g11764 [Triparma laevis f. inornata]|uniref:Uncharacterized protein n=1 Tax=Triparma laevis f. inornata TaxID=1714386 RepID=A0A9W7ERR7_9STRA|nr:hypothetical protein TL16_g11764 [Triparma laevis f. inornata]